MRSRGVRLDLFICMVLAALIFYGVYQGGAFVVERVSAAKDAQEVQVQVGNEVGYAPSEDVPVVETFQELAEHSDRFAMAMNEAALYSNGTITGENYEWRFVEIEDYIIAARVNMDNITDAPNSSSKIMLPVGRVIVEEPEILGEMRERFEGDGTIIVDAYIDMDGEANTTVVPFYQNFLTTFGMILIALVPILLFAAYIGAVFGIHAIGYKIGIFPPVFKKKITN